MDVTSPRRIKLGREVGATDFREVDVRDDLS
jgi:hypothetical protein